MAYLPQSARAQRLRKNTFPNNISNGISLRSGIYRVLDGQYFVIASIHGQPIAFFLNDCSDYAMQYHRSTAQLPSRISPSHLYSRFAFNVIQASTVRDLPITCNAKTLPSLLRLTASGSQGRHCSASQKTSTVNTPSDLPGIPDSSLCTFFHISFCLTGSACG
jgi:hypothetical protein